MAQRARPLRVVFPVFQCLRLYFLRGFSTLRAKVLRDFRPAPIFRPAQGRALIEGVPDIQPRSSLHQKPYDRVTAQGRNAAPANTVNTLVFKPIAAASVPIATTAKPGWRRKFRTA